jgi:hypothetical protein
MASDMSRLVSSFLARTVFLFFALGVGACGDSPALEKASLCNGAWQPHRQVEAKVDPRRRTSRRQEGALVDEQDVRVDSDLREASCELGGGGPVRGRPAAVEEPGRCEQERACADRSDAHAHPRRAADRVKEGLGYRTGDVGDPRQDDRVRLREESEPATQLQAERACVDLARDPAHPDLVSSAAIGEPDPPEHLAGRGEIEGEHAIQRDNGDPVHGGSLAHAATPTTTVAPAR